MGVKFMDLYHAHSKEIGLKKQTDSKKQRTELDFPHLPYFLDGDLKITEHLAIH